MKIFCFNILLLCLNSIAFVLSSCGNPSEIIEPTIKKIASETCYRYTKGNDTISMRLFTNGDKTTGELVYNWFEKDDNSGIISGIIKGDTLIADYTFMSEGIESVREEVFLKKGNDYWIGYGETEEKANKSIYKDYSELKLDVIKLSFIECSGKTLLIK